MPGFPGIAEPLMPSGIVCYSLAYAKFLTITFSSGLLSLIKNIAYSSVSISSKEFSRRSA
jgi:hypothetical protein